MSELVNELEKVAEPAWFSTAIAEHPEVSSIEVDGVAINYLSWGAPSAKPDVVLLHGGAAHARWWDHIAPLLALDRRVIAFDLSGHGDSGRRPSYDLDHWAAEALAVAGLSSTNKPILIGHSLGGVVALQAAITAGADLGGIVIVDSPILSRTPEENAAAERRAFGPPRVYPTAEELIARFRPIPDQDSIDYIRDHVASVSVREYDGGWGWKFDPMIFAHAPQLPVLGPLATRSAYIRGERGIVPREGVDEIIRGLGGATALIEIPDAGHAIMLDQPVALVTGLRAILAEWDLGR